MGDCLRKLLNSIKNQYNRDVQVVISDNASTDNTLNVIMEFESFFSDYKWFQQEYNIGPDRNYLKVVELAEGEYCWLMGSDDVLHPEAVQGVLRALDSQCDIYIGNRVLMDTNLQYIRQEKWLRGIDRNKIFDFRIPDELRDYFERSNSIGAVFSYLSSIIVHREKWYTVDFDTRFIGSGYSHAAILLSLVSDGATLEYIYDNIVFCRMGNDSFMENGYAKRVLIDIDGYIMLAELVPEDARWLFYKIIRRERDWLRLLKTRLFMSDFEWGVFKEKLTLIGWNQPSLLMIEKLCFLSPFWLLLEKIRTQIIKAFSKVRFFEGASLYD